MKRISMPALTGSDSSCTFDLDKFMIRLEQEGSKEYLSRLYTFWIAFIVRIIINIVTNSTNPVLSPAQSEH
jgi:hypothetical protein